MDTMYGKDEEGIGYRIVPDGLLYNLEYENGHRWEFNARSSKEALLYLSTRLGITWDIKCQCEHEDHFPPKETKHAYHDAPGGSLGHPWIGPICDDCAKTCLSQYELYKIREHFENGTLFSHLNI